MTKELIQQLREMVMIDEHGWVNLYSVQFTRMHMEALLDEIERLQAEVENLKKTSLEIEKPDGSNGYIQVHCNEKHDHFLQNGIGLKVSLPDTGVQFYDDKGISREEAEKLTKQVHCEHRVSECDAIIGGASRCLDCGYSNE